MNSHVSCNTKRRNISSIYCYLLLFAFSSFLLFNSCETPIQPQEEQVKEMYSLQKLSPTVTTLSIQYIWKRVYPNPIARSYNAPSGYTMDRGTDWDYNQSAKSAYIYAPSSPSNDITNELYFNLYDSDAVGYKITFTYDCVCGDDADCELKYGSTTVSIDYNDPPVSDTDVWASSSGASVKLRANALRMASCVGSNTGPYGHQGDAGIEVSGLEFWKKVPDPNTVPPDAPTNLHNDRDGQNYTHPLLDWNAVSGSGIYYRVYKKVYGVHDWSMQDATSNTYWEDTNATYESGAYYYIGYYVVAVNTNGESLPSNSYWMDGWNN